jgi:hypothetical protein
MDWLKLWSKGGACKCFLSWLCVALTTCLHQSLALKIHHWFHRSRDSFRNLLRIILILIQLEIEFLEVRLRLFVGSQYFAIQKIKPMILQRFYPWFLHKILSNSYFTKFTCYSLGIPSSWLKRDLLDKWKNFNLELHHEDSSTCHMMVKLS